MQYVLEQGQQYDWFDDATSSPVHRRRRRWPGCVRVCGRCARRSRSSICTCCAIGRWRRAACSAPCWASASTARSRSCRSTCRTRSASPRRCRATLLVMRAAAVMLFTPITAMLAERGIVDARISVGSDSSCSGISNWMLARLTTTESEFGRSSCRSSSAASGSRRSSCRSRSPCSAAFREKTSRPRRRSSTFRARSAAASRPPCW